MLDNNAKKTLMFLPVRSVDNFTNYTSFLHVKFQLKKESRDVVK